MGIVKRLARKPEPVAKNRVSCGVMRGAAAPQPGKTGVLHRFLQKIQVFPLFFR
jgi:hypothetical protein